LRKKARYEKYYENHKDKSIEELDFVEFEKEFEEYKQFIKRNNELSLRADKEREILQRLAMEALEKGYLYDQK